MTKNKVLIPEQFLWGSAVIAILLLIFLLLIPIYRLGYVADDLGKHVLNASNSSYNFNALLTSTLATMKANIIQGRLNLTSFVLHLITAPVFYAGVFASHSLTIFYTFLSLWSFYLVIKQLVGKRHQWLYLAFLFLPLLLQIRTYHDPFLVFSGDFQAFLALFFFSLWFLIKFLCSNKLSYGLLAVFLFFLAVNGHEANVMWWPSLLLIYYFLAMKFSWRSYWPLFINGLSCFFAYFTAPIFQHLLSLPTQNFVYDGTYLAFNLSTVLKTFLIQVSATLPLSFFCGRTGQEALSYYPHSFFDYLPVFFLALVIFAFLFYLLFLYRHQWQVKASGQKTLALLFLASSWFFLPALPVAVSAKYQIDLALFGMKSGTGYLMVYYQYFGLAILLAFLLQLIFKLRSLRLQKIILAFCVFLFAGIYYGTYLANWASVKQVAKAYDEHHFIFQKAKQVNLFAHLPAQINLLMNQRVSNYYYVDHGYWQYFKAIVSTTFSPQTQVINLNLITANEDLCPQFCSLSAEGPPTYYLYYDQIDEYSGYLILAPVVSFYQGLPLATEAQIFYYSAYLNDNHPGNIYPVLRRDLAFSFYTIDERAEINLKQERHWLVRDRQTNSSQFAYHSDVLFFPETLNLSLIQNDRASFNIILPLD